MNIHDLYEQRNQLFLKPSKTVRGGLFLCLFLGAVTLCAGFITGEHTRTWGSVLFNTFFFFSIALGGIAFAAMQEVVGAVWGRPIMRLHESFSSFLPVASGIFLILFLCILLKIGGADQVYRWIHNPDMLDHFWGKKDWLKPGFMVARDTVALALICGLSLWQLRLKLRRDGALMAGNKDKALEIGLEVKDKLRFWSAPILVVYALTFTLLAFDLTMSLAPTWFSTLWGGWAFSIMMQTLMATILICMFSLKNSTLGQFFQRQQFHDVGKLMHGFTIFFAYLTYAHVLTYWYGNVPEETEYFIHRLKNPWFVMILVVPLLSFVIPLFALLPKVAKYTAVFTIPVCVMILFAQWLTDLVVVIPEVVNSNNWGLPWIEIGGFLGVLGLFLSSFFWFGKRYPMVAVADPLLPKAYADSH